MIIHRFWMGRSMRPEYIGYGKKWRSLNPGVVVRDWGERDLGQFPALQRVFDDLYDRDAGRNGIELAVQIADVMGYALIEQFGGIYVNCDMEPVRPLPKFIASQAWASYENMVDGRINNAAIGAFAPHDPFWVALLKALPENYFARRLDEMVMSTGPGFLTEFAAEHDGLTVLPMTRFNSVHWKQINPGSNAERYVRSEGYPSDALAVHHWGHKKDGRTNLIESATQT